MTALLLVGGTGFVGQSLAVALRAAYPGWGLYLLSRSEASIPSEGWRLKVADYLDGSSVDAVLKRTKPSIVIHLAGRTSVEASLTQAADSWRANFLSTFNLASAVARHAPAGQFFFVSSSEVYGSSFRGGVVDENTVPLPITPYGRSKYACELMLADVLGDKTSLKIARSFNHTGPAQSERFVLPAFASQIAKIEAGLQEPRIAVGNLAAKRDFLHISDVVSAYIDILKLPNSTKLLLLNVAAGRVFPISHLLDCLLDMTSAKIAVEVNPGRTRPLDLPDTRVNVDRLRELTNWAPKISIQQMLAELLDTWRARLAAEKR